MRANWGPTELKQAAGEELYFSAKAVQLIRAGIFKPIDESGNHNGLSGIDNKKDFLESILESAAASALRVGLC